SGDGSTVDFPIIRAIPEDDGLREVSRTVVSATSALAQEEVLFSGHIGRKQQDVWEHVQRAGVPLKTIAYVNFGKQLRDRKKFTRDVITVSGLQRIPPGYRPCYTGRDVSRYHLVWGKLACFNLEVARHGGCWDPTRQDPKNKLITRQIGKYPEFALDCLGYQCLNTVFMVNLYATGYDPFYVLGILNSRLLRGYWLDRFWDQRRTFPKIKGAYLEQLPIHAIDPSDPRDKTRHDRMVELVGRMLDLHKQIRGTGILPVKKAGSDHGQDARATILLQRQIDATDRQIDALVYELYGLTDKEIAIVEGDG
ncbi:MAG: TaqI-like C-terminal specificity domain-containing protein, partial [Candidatus Methylomirabilota bacterium]